MTKYEIGQKVWWATFDAHRNEYIECPDCGGTGRLRVTFHDETTVSIECRNCSSGYDSPIGRIHIYTTGINVKQLEITGLEIENKDKVTYKSATSSHSSYRLDEEDLFLNREDAEAKAKLKAQEYKQRENERIFKKEKDTRSWAWNATYHKKQIKDAYWQIEYHTKKLNAANLKKKLTVNPPPGGGE